MLIKVHVEQLRLGMYIHEFCGSWMDHPFWRSSFLLEEEKVLKTILDSGIKEVLIDDAKGLGLGAVTAEVAGSEKASEMNCSPDATKQAVTPKARIQRDDLSHEATRAAAICDKSKRAVTSMFQEVRMGKALIGANALPIVDVITASILRNPDALIGLARLKSKDDYTYMHSIAVCALMVSLARTLGLDEEQTRQAGMAGLLHDIGKMATPLEIINKPGKLTDEEFGIIKSHPVEGDRILRKSSGISDDIRHACLHHHERVDGDGYPSRLKGEEIHLFARMCAICDVYDAITSTRAYKSGWEPSQSICKMAQSRGTHLDPRIFDAFVRSLGIYPVGTLVKLESEHLGIIVEQTEKSLLMPIVKVFFSIRSNSHIPVDILDLSLPGCKDKIVSHEDPVEWQLNDLHTLWSEAVP